MYVSFKRGEQPVKPKKATRKEQVQDMAQFLMKKWRHQDRLAALKKHSQTTNTNTK